MDWKLKKKQTVQPVETNDENFKPFHNMGKDQIKKMVISACMAAFLFISFVIAAYFTSKFHAFDWNSPLLRFPADKYLGTMVGFSTAAFVLALPMAHLMSQRNRKKVLWIEIISKIVGAVLVVCTIIAIVSAAYMLGTVPDHPNVNGVGNPYPANIFGNSVAVKNLINCVIGFNAMGLLFAFASSHLFIKKRYTTPQVN